MIVHFLVTALWLFLPAAAHQSVSAPGDLATVEVTLKTLTGGQLTGPVLVSDDHGIVVLSGNAPYVFAWSELEPGSALQARRALLDRERSGGESFSATDFFTLGQMALNGGRNDLASTEFERAVKLDRSLKPKVAAAFTAFRRRNEEWAAMAADVTTTPEVPPGRTDLPDFRDAPPFDALPVRDDKVREDVRATYLKFGEKVREELGRDIVLTESDHFLIWSDWGPKERTRLTQWAESMYVSLCAQFGLNPAEDIFLAKCPVFCFRSKARFARFAREFDGYDAKAAIGYTRSIEKNGHVHMAFARMGSSPGDYDRFACTLVHEGTHAFLHRVSGSRLLPHWVNEGYAELTAERVLGDRCPAGENARLLASQYARFDWPIESLLNGMSTIDVHQYPLAHSVVAHLEHRSVRGLILFIRDLKRGTAVPVALAGHFDGLTVEGLDRAWKQWIRESAPPPLADHAP